MSRAPVWLIFRCAADAPSVSILDGPRFTLTAAAVWSLAAGCEFCGRPGRDVNQMASVASTPHRICDDCAAEATALLEEQAMEVPPWPGSTPSEPPEVPEIEGALGALRELGPHADVLPALVRRVRVLLDSGGGQRAHPPDAPGEDVACAFCRITTDRPRLVSGPQISICCDCVGRVAPHLRHEDARLPRADLRVPFLRPAQPASELRIQVRRLSRDPSDPRAWFRVGWLFQEKGDVARAVAAFVHAAVIFSASGYLLKALATWRKVIEIDPSWTEAVAASARIEQELGLAPVTDPPPSGREGHPAAVALDALDSVAFRELLASHLARARDSLASPVDGHLLRHLCPGRVPAMRSGTLARQARDLPCEQIDAIVAFLVHMLAEPRAQEYARDVVFGLETIWRPLARVARYRRPCARHRARGASRGGSTGIATFSA